MRVLQICHKPPYPPVDGGCIAIKNITAGLLEKNVNLKMITAETLKHPFIPSALPENILKKVSPEPVFIDTRVRAWNAMLNLFSGKSYNISRFYSAQLEKKIIEVVGKNAFDVVHLESLFVTPYIEAIRRKSRSKIVLRAHNVEFEIWENLARTERNFFKRRYLKQLSERLRKYELATLNECDGIAVISKENMEKFRNWGCTKPMEYIPFGINLSEYDKDPNYAIENHGSDVFFLAAMDWLPNQEGLEWFFEKVWKLVLKKNPEMKMTAAGRKMPQKFLRSKFQNVEIRGEVPDAKQFMRENSLMVVPLFSGSGVRVKIIEAMALGKVIVATSHAAKGIGVENEKNILIADSPDKFAELICMVKNRPDLQKTIAANAVQFVKSEYEYLGVTTKLIAFYRQLQLQ